MPDYEYWIKQQRADRMLATLQPMTVNTRQPQVSPKLLLRCLDPNVTSPWRTEKLLLTSSLKTVLLDTDPAAIAQTELLASVLVLLQAVYHPSQMVSLKSKPSHAIFLLNIHQWLSVVTRIKTKTLNMAQDHAQFVPHLSLQPAPVPSLL